MNNLRSNNYNKCKSNFDRNRILSVNEYLNKIRTYLKVTINNLKKSGTWKNWLTTAINLICSNDEELSSR